MTIKQAQNKLQRKKAKAEDSLQKLLQLDSRLKLKDEAVELMLRRARTGHYVIPEQKPKEDEDDVFTAEDFAKFEKDYFVS